MFRLQNAALCDSLTLKVIMSYLFRRGYTAARYQRIIDNIRRYMPNASVSGDAIVGFPGETEEQFQATCRCSLSHQKEQASHEQTSCLPTILVWRRKARAECVNLAVA